MKRFRVECNFGCRYFKDIEKAEKYFKKCKAKHLDVELWVACYSYCPMTGYFGYQELLDYSGTKLPKN